MHRIKIRDVWGLHSLGSLPPSSQEASLGKRHMPERPTRDPWSKVCCNVPSSLYTLATWSFRSSRPLFGVALSEGALVHCGLSIRLDAKATAGPQSRKWSGCVDKADFRGGVGLVPSLVCASPSLSPKEGIQNKHTTRIYKLGGKIQNESKVERRHRRP